MAFLAVQSSVAGAVLAVVVVVVVVAEPWEFEKPARVEGAVFDRPGGLSEPG